MKIAIIGGGKWGLALHFAMSQRNHVVLHSRNKKNIKDFVSKDEAFSCDMLIFAIAAQATRQYLKDNFVNNGQKILVASKGIDLQTKEFLHQIYTQFVSEENLAYLSGPSFAKEVMNALPTALVISSSSDETANAFSALFPPFIKTYTSKDVIGAEVAGAYKNIIAIASGISDGLSMGNNARAALITRGLAEMMRFGMHFGAKKQTFLGLSGAGDLFLTASSELSRNYRLGYLLAQKKPLQEILQDLQEVAEGLPTTKAVVQIAKKHEIYTPIAKEVCEVINGKDVLLSMQSLMTTTSTKEFS